MTRQTYYQSYLYFFFPMITFLVSAVIRLHKTQMEPTHKSLHKTHTGQRAYLAALISLADMAFNWVTCSSISFDE